jgi:hypothetical protein
VGEASTALDDRLQVNDLRTWVREDNETPITVCKDDEDTVAEVLNRRRAEYVSEDDSENEEMCELETPKISKPLDSISEVMNWLEGQSDCDHFHLLYLQNIKAYVTKKISDYFKNTN